ncbi:MAG: hypothetical protein A2633_01105 [Candidatus Sungbacteria bacterium RIFCSPHIGHO2_01_FULL_47_32]|uniref:Ribosomal subunit interface protein n=1 Tax=Candidatus Sungbacteria bacterium RIFCSPHIGHO2_01_FULL_47_32 TaxID=1802264 RepID=A0A1G2K6Y8_9BACT|nr:MAG: hypothetical protein A2633_01105 [Candidatus Sungbacteria bacterium RIFCSPHIGHO2_01_FULL_47_32]OGZ99620.1 MAG: hypothetical protein A3D57_04940 [Candidatus Sungbacteria bacterium RIFCSPHIGHO2_02_FULL_46_12]
MKIMKLSLKATGFKFDEALRIYTVKKIVEPVKKFLSRGELLNTAMLDVEIGRTSSHHKKGLVWRAEANLAIPHAFFRAEAEAEDVRSAIDILEAEIAREVLKYKQKKIQKAKRGARLVKAELKFDPELRTQKNKRGR